MTAAQGVSISIMERQCPFKREKPLDTYLPLNTWNLAFLCCPGCMTCGLCAVLMSCRLGLRKTCSFTGAVSLLPRAQQGDCYTARHIALLHEGLHLASTDKHATQSCKPESSLCEQAVQQLIDVTWLLGLQHDKSGVHACHTIHQEQDKGHTCRDIMANKSSGRGVHCGVGAWTSP